MAIARKGAWLESFTDTELSSFCQMLHEQSNFWVISKYYQTLAEQIYLVMLWTVISEGKREASA